MNNKASPFSSRSTTLESLFRRITSDVGWWTAGAQPAGLHAGEFVASAGVTKANRELVAHEFAATTGEDGRTAGEARTVLLALMGGGPSDEAALQEYGAADRGAVASGGIAEAVAGRSIQSQEGTEGFLTRPDQMWLLLLNVLHKCPTIYFHLSVKVIVLFFGSCLEGSILAISSTIGTFAKRPAKMQVPVGNSGK